ncbi:hypothetical protein Gotur_006991 [Gossypium turneri]
MHKEYITMWNNRLGRVSQMDRALDLQPSLEYIQWQPLPDSHHAPEPDLYSGDSSYHPDLRGNDYFSGSSGHEYHSEFDIFSPLPPQYSSPLGPYPLLYSTPAGSILSIAFETYDFSSMFRIPLHTDEENVDRRNQLQRERRAPQKYALRTTPSNHQF